jgi:hypothetical protein
LETIAVQKEYALFNLKEAKEAIEQLMAEMEADSEYEIGNYRVDMQHLYWHINSAWNGREFDMATQELKDGMYEAFIQFPKDLAL